jgi:glycosyltransferase involved in cell wall biosynthesis
VTAPLFSVIVPTYDRSRFLAEALASVFGQAVGDFECLVVDDASPDPVTLPEPIDRRVRLIRREHNGGPAAARNSGLTEARGRYVTFLDDDDLFTPDRLQMAVEGLARAPVAICWTAFLDEPGAGHGRRLEGDVRDVVLDGLTPALGAVAVEREVVPLFDESLDNMEDVDWWFRISQSQRVATVRRVGHLYRRHGTPRHRTGTAARAQCNLEFLRRHAGYFEGHPRAAAFRWKRVGLLGIEIGDYALARRAFLRSIRWRATPSTAWHLLRCVGQRSVSVTVAERP